MNSSMTAGTSSLSAANQSQVLVETFYVDNDWRFFAICKYSNGIIMHQAKKVFLLQYSTVQHSMYSSTTKKRF
jgi:hypothetical protein